MNQPVVLIAGITLASSLLILAFGLIMARGWTRRNRWFGLRTRQTLEDDRTWDVANRAAGRAAMIAGASVALMSVLVIAFSNQLTVGTAGMVLAISVLLAVFRAVMRGYAAQRSA